MAMLDVEFSGEKAVETDETERRFGT
jgi:hypothetical protein